MKLQTPREVIAALGGIKIVAELTGRDYYAAANWNREENQTFPSSTYFIMQRALKKARLKASPALWGMDGA